MLTDLDRFNGSAQVGIFIGESDEWGKGYGTDAVRALVDFGFAELRLERIWLEVGTENPRAKRSYEKAGFTHEGTFRHDRWEGGRYTDGHVMSILQDEWQSRRS
jgi:RimJ/RimL family protein N-acetyltransferase